MDLSDIESFHYLYRSLWQAEEGSKRHVFNMMDTIIFQHGHPFRWIFTSEKTGEVLKKKECKLTASEIVNVLKKRSGRLRGKKIIHHERSKFASVWYRTDTGAVAFRLLDEAELYFILGDRTYTQFVSAIQVFFGGFPLKGCGIFEHHYVHSLNTAPIHRTFELVHMPQSIDIFDLVNNLDENGGPMPVKDIAIQSKSSQGLSDTPPKQERMYISETQHDILAVQTNKLMKLIEKTVRAKVTKATFLFYFNTSWTPFVVACTKMQLESQDATIPVQVGEAPPMAQTQLDAATPPPAKQTISNIDVHKTDIHVVKSTEKKRPKLLSRTSTEIYSTAKDWQVKLEIAEELAKADEQNAPPPATPAQDPNAYIPPPNSSLPKSKINYDDGEVRAPEARKQLKSKFGGKRHSVLDNFITLSPGKHGGAGAAGGAKKNESSAPSKQPVFGRKGIQNELSTKQYTAPTDSHCVRVKAEPDIVRRSDDPRWQFTKDGKNRRPISAPHTLRVKRLSMGASRSGSSLNMSSYNLPKGKHGVAEGGTRATGLQRKLPLQGQVCFGDYCNLLTPLAVTLDDTDEYLKSVDMMKCTGADGKVRLKCTKPEQQISCKTVLLGRAESKYIGGEVQVMENIESYEYTDEDVINACAKQHILRVAEKCRKEAFSSLIKGGLEAVPSMSNLQATAFQYRNLIYNDALSQVHPSKFYYTVPACKVCFQLYSALDKVRDTVIHRPQSGNESNRRRPKSSQNYDGDDPATDIVQKAREALRERADLCREPQSRKRDDKRPPDGYEDEGIYEDNSEPHEHDEEGDTDAMKLATCVEGEEASLFSPRQDSSEVERVDECLDGNLWEYDAVTQRNGVQKLPATSTAEPDHFQERIRISKPITRSYSTGGRKLTEEELEVERRKAELMSGSHLGGQYRGANETVSKNTASTQALIKTLTGNKSNGSMAIWADLIKSGKKTGSQNGERGRLRSPPQRQMSAESWTSRRESMTSPEVLARRASVIEDRKLDRTQWHESLRNESLSPKPTRRKRPSSAATTRKASVFVEKKKPLFAVRSGQDLKTITGTFAAVEPGKPRPKSASATRKETARSRQRREDSQPHGDMDGGLVEDSKSATYSSGMDMYITNEERERLSKLREEILRERVGGGGIHSNKVIDMAQTFSKGDYSYGHVPFTDAQCLPYRGYGSNESPSGNSADNSGSVLGYLESATFSDVSPRDMPNALPIPGNLQSSKRQYNQ